MMVKTFKMGASNLHTVLSTQSGSFGINIGITVING